MLLISTHKVICTDRALFTWSDLVSHRQSALCRNASSSSRGSSGATVVVVVAALNVTKDNLSYMYVAL